MERLDLPETPNHRVDYRRLILPMNLHFSLDSLTADEQDVILHGVPFLGERYPLDYVFWAQENWIRVRTNWNWRDIQEKEGWQVGEQIIENENPEIFRNSTRALILLDEGYVTSLSYTKVSVDISEELQREPIYQEKQ